MFFAFVFPAIAQAPVADRSILSRFQSPFVGEPGAKVEIVEFLDPACEGCRALYPYVKKILEEYHGRVRLTIRYVAFHRGADEVVKLLEAARRQRKYPETLEILFATQPRWAVNHVARLDLALKAVGGIGLDMARLRADMADPQLVQLLKQDMKDAVALQVDRTPTFFVNGKPLVELGYEELRALVVQEIRQSYGAAPGK